MSWSGTRVLRRERVAIAMGLNFDAVHSARTQRAYIHVPHPLGGLRRANRLS